MVIVLVICEGVINGKGEGLFGMIGDFELLFLKGWKGDYIVDIDGVQNYQVDIGVLNEDNVIGIVMWIFNMLCWFVDVLVFDQECIIEIEWQIFGFEKQIGLWLNVKELVDIVVWYCQFIDVLKFKLKGEIFNLLVIEQDVDSVLLLKEGKWLDFVICNVEFGFMLCKLLVCLVDYFLVIWVKNVVLNDGQCMGYEFFVVIDDDGSIVEYGMFGWINNMGMSVCFVGVMVNEDCCFVVYYNYLLNLFLLVLDFVMLVWFGMYFVVVNGYDGCDMCVVFIELVIKVIKCFNYMFMLCMLENVWQDVFVKLGMMESGDGNFWKILVFEIVVCVNIIDFENNMLYDFKVLKEIDDVVESVVFKFVREFYGESVSISLGICGFFWVVCYVGGMVVVVMGCGENVFDGFGLIGLVERVV